MEFFTVGIVCLAIGWLVGFLTSRLLNKRLIAEDIFKNAEISKMHSLMATEFENIANKILTQNTERFHSTTEKNLAVLMEPMKERIVLDIANRGGELYDKFCLFVDSLNKIGKSIKDTQVSYDEAMDRLRDGKGNLIAQVEDLKKLGVKAEKQLSSKQLAEDNDQSDK